MLTPKELLASDGMGKANSPPPPPSPAQEAASSSSRFSTSSVASTTTTSSPNNQNTSSSGTAPGKQGFLWREVDPLFTTSLMETHQRVWVLVVQNQLLFSESVPSSISENLFIAESSRRPCLGYISLNSHSDVKVKHADKVTGMSAASSRRFSFTVKDGESSITFCAESEQDRQAWFEVIRQAINGTNHTLSHMPIVIPNFQVNKISSSFSESNASAIEFPHKAGYLKKSSQGNSTFGIKSVKKRWFRLEGGELRYYEDEDVRPSKLKDTCDLKGSRLLNSDQQNSNVVQLQLTNGRLMKLEAPTLIVALEWRDALSETISLLQYQKSVEGEFKNIRRFNIHERRSEDEKKQIVANNNNNRNRSGSFSSPNSNTRSTRSPSVSGSSQTSPVGGGSSSSFRANSFKATTDASPTPSTINTPATSSYKAPALLDMLKACLQSHFLIKTLQDINPIIDLLKEKVAVAGEVILWQGSSGDQFYILDKGQCEVIKDNKRIAFINPGKSFGEMALLNNAVRQATVRATQSCRLWCLSRRDFRDVAAAQERTKLEEKMRFLRGIELFEKFLDSSLERVAEVMVLKTYQLGDKIIRQGDVGDCFYMIATGRVAVTQQASFGSTPIELVRLGPGKYFGELALIEDAPRKATVTATTLVTCWTVDRVNFLNLFGSMSNAVQESIGVKMLRQVKLLESLSDRQLMEISKRLVSTNYVEGAIIIKQGDIGDSFYMISSGEVAVQVNHVQVATLEAGSFFGEMSLLSNERRSATVVALVDTTCLVLSRSDFTELLGPLDEIIKAESKKRNDALAAAERRKSSGFLGSFRSFSVSMLASSPTTAGKGGRRESNTNNALFANTNSMFEIDQLEKVKALGQGTFGGVSLVQHNVTSKYYSMKSMVKEFLFTTDQEKYVYSERDIQLALGDCPFIPALYATLQDEKRIYFVQQYFPGGDLWSILYSNKLSQSKAGGIAVHQAQFYAANIFCAINYMHEHDIVYRDLKPENIMLDATGYVKIIDFGSAINLTMSQKTTTLCGTPEYIAPEMILCKGYGRAVDLWSFGIFIFELLTRSTPFSHSNLAMVYQNILESEETLNIRYGTTPNIDSTGKQLISSLLLLNPCTRIGMLHEGARDIWNHAFFRGITEEQIAKKSIPAPYLPPSEDLDSMGSNAVNTADTLDFIDMLEDPDDIPSYTGCYDYSQL